MGHKNWYLSNEENDIIKEYSKKWNISQEETAKKIIREFHEDN